MLIRLPAAADSARSGGVSIPLVFIGASEHSLFALLMAAQRRHMAGAEALRWVQEQLLRTRLLFRSFLPAHTHMYK